MSSIYNLANSSIQTTTSSTSTPTTSSTAPTADLSSLFNGLFNFLGSNGSDLANSFLQLAGQFTGQISNNSNGLGQFNFANGLGHGGFQLAGNSNVCDESGSVGKSKGKQANNGAHTEGGNWSVNSSKGNHHFQASGSGSDWSVSGNHGAHHFSAQGSSGKGGKSSC
jgi:hypothetical protein